MQADFHGHGRPANHTQQQRQKQSDCNIAQTDRHRSELDVAIQHTDDHRGGGCRRRNPDVKRGFGKPLHPQKTEHAPCDQGDGDIRRQKLEMQRAQFTPRRIHSHKRKQQHGNDQILDQPCRTRRLRHQDADDESKREKQVFQIRLEHGQ